MENRALRVSWLVATLLMLASIAAGIVLGFARGRIALGVVLCVGVPAVLASPAAAFRAFDRRTGGGSGSPRGKSSDGPNDGAAQQ
ncbi:hypothetical protein [Salinispira pacifica]